MQSPTDPFPKLLFSYFSFANAAAYNIILSDA